MIELYVELYNSHLMSFKAPPALVSKIPGVQRIYGVTCMAYFTSAVRF